MPDRDVTTTEQEWTYVGRRELASGGLGHTWLDPDGAERVFKKGTVGVVGGTYLVHATPNRASLVTAGANCPRFLRVDGHDSRIAGWEAADGLAYGADQLRKSEAKAKRDGAERFGALTLNDIRGQMHTATAPGRAALLARVLRQIGV